VDESAGATDVPKKPRSKWRRFASLFFRHLLPIPFYGIVILGFMNMSRDGGLEHNLIFIVAVAALLSVLVVIGTRACLESLVCLLMMTETICLAFFYEHSWPVVWTRVTVLQIFVATALFFWMTVLRIRKRKFSTWLICTEIITVLSFAANIYIHAAYWLA